MRDHILLEVGCDLRGMREDVCRLADHHDVLGDRGRPERDVQLSTSE